jgi:hypothetical protein
LFFPLVTEDGEWISVRFSGRAYLLPIMDGFAYHPYCGWESATTERIFAAVDQLHLLGGTPPPLWWTESGFDTESRHGGYFGVSAGIARERGRAGRARAAGHAGGQHEPARRRRLQLPALRRGDLSRWQSELVRPDGSPKPAFSAFARAFG